MTRFGVCLAFVAQPLFAVRFCNMHGKTEAKITAANPAEARVPVLLIEPVILEAVC
jgi:hypothetical protein